MHRRVNLRGLVVATLIALAPVASFQQDVAQAQSSEERFQDLFITAGYCTAFGAALGTAFLAWTENPAENLRYVAVGASLGFIGGSLLGTYVIFSPMVDNGNEPVGGTLLSGGPMPTDTVVIRPTWDREGQRVAAVEGGMTLFSF